MESQDDGSCGGICFVDSAHQRLSISATTVVTIE